MPYKFERYLVNWSISMMISILSDKTIWYMEEIQKPTQDLLLLLFYFCYWILKHLGRSHFNNLFKITSSMQMSIGPNFTQIQTKLWKLSSMNDNILQIHTINWPE